MYSFHEYLMKISSISKVNLNWALHAKFSNLSGPFFIILQKQTLFLAIIRLSSFMNNEDDINIVVLGFLLNKSTSAHNPSRLQSHGLHTTRRASSRTACTQPVAPPVARLAHNPSRLQSHGSHTTRPASSRTARTQPVPPPVARLAHNPPAFSPKINNLIGENGLLQNSTTKKYFAHQRSSVS